jgi:hypothetical protein
VPANPLYARCVRRAAELAGGYEALSEHVEVSVRQLEAWGAGEGTPPTAVFLRIVDLILDPGAGPPSARRGNTPRKDGPK